MTNMGTQGLQEFHLDGVHCALQIKRYPGGVVILTISGTDIGEFGARPMLALKEWVVDAEPVRLFIDAREVRGASISVSGEWAIWLRAQKANLQSISMLTGSRYVEITADFVRRFAELESIMRVYTDPVAFDAALAEAIA
ncbi:MAG TPA: hypothetical protein VK724_11370 [Bryobacteraceae bacterium]|jgi:hypothetical protein|nr:hypothetical protein [Bryobacteraceae bacterium]